MNRTNQNPADPCSAQQPIYYARVASTEGDKVKIFRYGFDLEYRAMARKILKERNPLRKAVLRHEMVSFILQHIDEYNGDKKQLMKDAATLAWGALFDVEGTIFATENEIRINTLEMREIEDRHGIKLEQYPHRRTLPHGVVFSTANPRPKHPTSASVYGDVQHKLHLLLRRSRQLDRQLREYRQICPRHIEEEIVRNARMFEKMGY